MRFLPIVLLVACGQDQTPAVCEQMCRAAADLYGDCLDEWGVDWAAAGYDNEKAYIHSCETWSWEMSILEEDALDNDQIDKGGWVESTCEDRDAIFSRDDATCLDYTDIDWNHTPWDHKGGDQL